MGPLEVFFSGYFEVSLPFRKEAGIGTAMFPAVLDVGAVGRMMLAHQIVPSWVESV